jgi:hypothetical protein
MTSFKQARDLLLFSFYNKQITAEQLLVLLEENTSQNPEFDYLQYERFDLATIPEPECRSNFRFDKDDIPLLADAGMLADSNLLNFLEQHAYSPDGEPMCIYGDPAYPLRVHLQASFRDVLMTPAMQEFNRSMSAVRVSVEWA